MKIGSNFKIGNAIYARNTNFLIYPVLSNIVHGREYRVLEEVQSKVIFEETGVINRLNIRNDSKYPVFIRAGEILSGKSQNRTIKRSIVIFPSSSEDMENEGYKQIADVYCVHASQPISSGTFSLDCLMPHSYDQSFFSQASQNQIWSMNCAYEPSRTANNYEVNMPGVPLYKQDDMLKKVNFTISVNKNEVEKVIESIPSDAIGIVVVNNGLIIAIEVFDSKHSWNAIKRKIIQKYSNEINCECSHSNVVPVTYIESRVNSILENKFRVMARYHNSKIVNNKAWNSTVYIGNLGRYEGEITKLGKKLIHFACVIGTKTYNQYPVHCLDAIDTVGPLTLEY